MGLYHKACQAFPALQSPNPCPYARRHEYVVAFSALETIAFVAASHEGAKRDKAGLGGVLRQVPVWSLSQHLARRGCPG